MLDTPLMSLLETSLDYSSTQQSAISANLSNLNTPGYQRKDADFATVLSQAAETDGRPAGLLSGSIPKDGGESADGAVPLVTDTSSPMRVDGNNVDVDIEMSKLAKNQIYYQAVSQFMGGQLSNLKYVIGGG
jgi:flagellar basal-body rod protein FlgB